MIVDAYGPDEQAMGWFYYLDDKLSFPFGAKCIKLRSISPLRKGEEVTVLRMATCDDCRHELFVIIHLGKRRLGVPLARLKPTTGDSETREAIADWHYWISRGYEF